MTVTAFGYLILVATFPSYLKSLFQNESSWKTFHMKMSLIDR